VRTEAGDHPRRVNPALDAPLIAPPSLEATSRVLGFLRGAPGLSADDALVEALPYMEPQPQAVALETLIARGNDASLAAAVAHFHGGGRPLKALLTAHIRQLAEGVRLALSSSEFEQRAGAIEAVVAGDDAASAYHLVELLRSPCLRTRELAATGLRSLTASWLEKSEVARAKDSRCESETPPEEASAVPTADSAGSGNGTLQSQGAALLSAMSEAVRTWDLHLQPRALEGALWLGRSIIPAFGAQLNDERGGLTRIVRRRLEHASDARMAEFIWCALGIPTLRTAAAKAISSATDAALIHALGRQTHWLSDPQIARGFHHVRECVWLDSPPDKLLRAFAGDALTIVKLIAAMGGGPEVKARRLRALADSGDESLVHEAMRAITQDPGESAIELLAVLARRGGGAARLAEAELRRRQSGVGATAGPTSGHDQLTGGSAPAEPWDRLFEEWDELSAAQRTSALERLDGAGVNTGAKLRAALRSSLSVDRRKALTIVRDCRRPAAFSAEIYRLSHDADAVVRSLAIATLADLPGATSELILRNAVEDADPRVQANAIESLDTLGTPNRRSITRRKLTAAHNRVRANAIRSLLRLELGEAGEALLNMLEDESGAHRMSALWVIERLQLNAVIHRVIEISRNDPDERVRQRALRVVESVRPSRSEATGTTESNP